jgi:hypothetical protein
MSGISAGLADFLVGSFSILAVIAVITAVILLLYGLFFKKRG